MTNSQIIKLESVGTAIDPDTMITYPMTQDDAFEIEDLCGIHIEDVSDEWLEKLNVTDSYIVGGCIKNRINFCAVYDKKAFAKLVDLSERFDEIIAQKQMA